MKIGKRLLACFMCITLLFCSVILLTACLKEDKQCAHEWSQWQASTAATCLEQGTKQRTCNKCSKKEVGIVAATGHTFDSAWTNDEAYHWHSATCAHTAEVSAKAAHDWNDGEITTAATCTTKGIKTFTCLDCAKTKTEEMAESVHTFDSAWTSDETHHWHAATCTHTAEVSEKAAHDWNAGEITTAATCTDKGVKTFTCSDCAKTKTEEIAATGHTFDSAWTSDETHHWHAATCAHTAEVSEKAAHDWNDGEITTAVTCTTKGIKTFACSDCAKTKTEEIAELGHDLKETITAATCVDRGSKVYECKNCDYTKTEIMNATGHSWNILNPTCTQDKVCSMCDSKVPMLGHSWQLSIKTPATCTEDGKQTMQCNHCGNKTEEITDLKTGHTVAKWTQITEQLKEGETCVYNYLYEGQCNSCDQILQKTEEAIKHSFKGAITTAATCIKEGEKTFTCLGCNHQYTEKYTDAEAHRFDSGTTAGNITTYTCEEQGCGKQKTTISAKEEITTTVSKEDLQAAGEVELKEASVQLDESALNGLNGQVGISADTLKGEDLTVVTDKLTEEQKKQLGDNPVYNFTMTSDDKPVTDFSGKVTVRIPYTLAEGEDPDCIAVWYIKDDGRLESMKAVYSNGFAVFETTHFSYYTVTRLTPAERCKLYGHNYIDAITDPTCVSEGFTFSVCHRCGDSVKKDIKPATGHNFIKTETPATCTNDGKATFTCQNCTYSYDVKIAAIGHNWLETERKDSTCTASGHVVSTCENCKDSFKNTIIQKKHSMKAEVTLPTCTTNGFTVHSCITCTLEYTDTFVNATGHNHALTVIAATCSADGYTQHKCKDCDDSFTSDLVAAHHVWDYAVPNCGNGQKCVVCGEAGLPKTGEHQMQDGLCTVCGEGCDHAFTESVVAATCTNKGYHLKECSKCKTEVKSQFTPALGHNGEVECLHCGEQLMPDNFFITAMDSLMNQPFTIKLEDFMLEVEAGEPMKINVYELYIGLNETGITAEGYGNVKSIGGSVEPNLNIKLVIKNGFFYFNMMGNNDYYSTKQEDTYTYAPLSSVLLINQEFGAIIETLPQIKAWYQANLKEMVDKVMFVHQTAINMGLGKVAEKLFIIEKNGSGYAFKFDIEALQSLNTLLSDNNIEQILERYYGEGAFNKLTTKVLGLLDLTVGEVLDAIDAVGIDLKTVISAGDSLLTMVSGGLCNSIEEFVAMITGNEVGDIYELLQSEQVRATVIGELISKATNLSVAQIKEQISGTLSMVSKMKPYEIIAMIAGVQYSEEFNEMIKTTINDILLLVKPALNIGFTTNLNGVVQEIHVNMMPSENIPFSINLSLVANYSSTMDYTELVNTIDNYVKTIIIEDTIVDLLPNNADVIFEKDSDGNIIGFTYVHKNTNFLKEYQDGDYIIRFYRETTIEEHIGFENTVITFVKDCGDWVAATFNLVNNYKDDVIEKKATYNNKGELISEEIVFEDHTESKGYGKAIEILCNMSTGKMIIDQFRHLTKHKYVVDESLSIPPVGCVGEGEVHYYCTECGDTYKDIITNGHNFTTKEYVFDGEKDCAQGVTVFECCSECGEKHEQQHFNEHYRFDERFADYNFCENHSLRYSACPCEKEQNIDFNYRGMMPSWEYIEINGQKVQKSIYTCRDGCSLKIEIYSLREVVDNCLEIVKDFTRVYSNEVLVKEITQIRENETHQYETFVTLKEGAKSCEEGVIVAQTCLNCGISTTKEEKHHRYGISDVIDLTKYGAEDGKFILQGCACGKENYGKGYRLIEGQYEQTSWTEGEKEIEEYTSLANANFVVRIVSYIVMEGCNQYRIEEIMVGYHKEDSTCQFSKVIKSLVGDEHTIERTGELLEGAKTCNDGIIITEYCLNCDYTNYYEMHGYHTTFTTETIDLAKYGSICGGTIEIRSCPCGYENSYSRKLLCDMQSQYVDDFTTIYTCAVTDPKKCGYSIKEVSSSIKEGCYGTNYVTLYLGYNHETGESLREVRVKNNTYDDHAIAIKGEYLEGSKTCIDGIKVTQYCINCDYEYSYEMHEHRLFTTETIDLAKYGSICGGTIELMSCLCGAKGEYAEKANCTFGRYHDGDQTTIYTCERNDQCGFSFKEVRSYEKDNNCRVTSYVTLYLGYNHETGEYQYAVPNIKLNSYIQHSFKDSVVESFDSKGNRVETSVLMCLDCKITDRETTIRTYDKQNYIIRKEVIEEDEFAIRKTISEYMYHLSYQYQTLSRKEYVSKDGTSKNHWSQTEKSYTFDGVCSVFIVYTDSYGKRSESEANACYHTFYESVNTTCTQEGFNRYYCNVCKNCVDEDVLGPNGHAWYYNDSLGLYECSACSLQNINGVDGSIVLEDLSVKLSADKTEYVAGYWKKDAMIEYVINITLIDKADKDNHILVEGVKTVDDGHSIVRFNINDVETWAKENGYDLSKYDIRLSFVPIGGDGQLDYGITFTQDNAPLPKLALVA